MQGMKLSLVQAQRHITCIAKTAVVREWSAALNFIGQDSRAQKKRRYSFPGEQRFKLQCNHHFIFRTQILVFKAH